MMDSERSLLPADANTASSTGLLLFHVGVIVSFLAMAICGISFPDIATAYLNGGTDPCVGTGRDSIECEDALATAAMVIPIGISMQAACAFFFSPVIGLWSDRVGRKPVLLAGCVISSLQCFALLGTQMLGLSIYWYILALIISGVVPLQVPSFLWLADISSNEDRMWRFSLLSGLQDSLWAVAALLNMMVSQRVRIWFAIALAMTGIVILACGISESRVKNHIARASARRHSIVEGLMLFATWNNFRIVATMFVLVLAVIGANSSSLLTYKLQFGFNSEDVSPYLVFGGLCNLLSEVGLAKFLSRALGLRNLIFFVMASFIADFAIQWRMDDPRLLLPAYAFGGIGSVWYPAMLAVFMNIAPPKLHGQVQGIFNSVLTAANFLGPVVFGGFLSLLSRPGLIGHRPYPEGVWLVAAAVMLPMASVILQVPVAAFESSGGMGENLEVGALSP